MNTELSNVSARAPEPKSKVPQKSMPIDPIQIMMDAEAMAHIKQLGEIYAKSQWVPAHFRGKVADCMVALQLSLAMRIHPLQLMQHSFIIHGKPGFETQIAIAALNASGRTQGPPEYTFTGERGTDDWGCFCSVIDRSGRRVDGPRITIGLAKAEGWMGKKDSKWRTMPDQMLRYRAASWMIRSSYPEVMMGIQTVDELEDIGPSETILGSDSRPSGGSALDQLTEHIRGSLEGPKSQGDDTSGPEADPAPSKPPAGSTAPPAPQEPKEAPGGPEPAEEDPTDDSPGVYDLYLQAIEEATLSKINTVLRPAIQADEGLSIEQKSTLGRMMDEKARNMPAESAPGARSEASRSLFE